MQVERVARGALQDLPDQGRERGLAADRLGAHVQDRRGDFQALVAREGAELDGDQRLLPGVQRQPGRLGALLAEDHDLGGVSMLVQGLQEGAEPFERGLVRPLQVLEREQQGAGACDAQQDAVEG
ncbi:hypothetical protein D3C87_1850530 [compost metagenome]